MNDLRISLIQSEIVWENKEKNRKNFFTLLSLLKGKSDLVVLPELFTTGFSVKAKDLAETCTDQTIQVLLEWAKIFRLAICGSFLAKDIKGGVYWNKGFFITPAGETFFSDKRHLFRLSDEIHLLTAGKTYTIILYKEWRIRLIICYDLRFPVWIRNKNNEYDLLLCVANWPQARSSVWKVLLKARSIENLCYTCGVNRVGSDGNFLYYQGDSMLLDYKGETILQAPQNQPSVLSATICQDSLQEFRRQFLVWKDADDFNMLK